MAVEKAIVPAPKPRCDETLVNALMSAHRWRGRIESGKAKSITDLSEQENVTVACVCRLFPSTCLALDIKAILDRRQRKGLRLAGMLGNGLLGGGAAKVLGFIAGLCAVGFIQVKATVCEPQSA